MRLSRVYLWGLVAAAGLSVVAPVLAAFISIIPLAGFGSMELLLFGILVVLYFAIGLICAIVMEHGRAPRLMLLAIVGGVPTTLGWIAMLWTGGGVEPFLVVQFLTWPTAVVCLIALIGVLLLPARRRGWWLWLRRGAILMSCLLALHIGFAVSFYPVEAVGQTGDWEDLWRYEDIAYRIGTALTLVGGAMVVGVFLPVWLGRLVGAPRAPTAILSYRVECPRCGCAQEAMTGASSCQRCGLTIRVEVM